MRMRWIVVVLLIGGAVGWVVSVKWKARAEAQTWTKVDAFYNDVRERPGQFPKDVGWAVGLVDQASEKEEPAFKRDRQWYEVTEDGPAQYEALRREGTREEIAAYRAYANAWMELAYYSNDAEEKHYGGVGQFPNAMITAGEVLRRYFKAPLLSARTVEKDKREQREFYLIRPAEGNRANQADK